MCIPSALASTAARLCCIEQKAFHTHYVDFFVAVQQIDAPADADHGVALAAEPFRAAAEPRGVVGMRKRAVDGGQVRGAWGWVMKEWVTSTHLPCRLTSQLPLSSGVDRSGLYFGMTKHC